ncbi:MAG: RNA methyltransferase [Thermomicrobia bacterium]|nr:RNA methyltransferase [Thermomicrobia bacterium]
MIVAIRSLHRRKARREQGAFLVEGLRLAREAIAAHAAAHDGFVLILDGVRDPGNVGTLIRAAAAADCDAVITIAGTADAYAPKVVRSAMGAHFRLPVVADSDWKIVGPALAALPSVCGADGVASLIYDAVDGAEGCAIVIGNEDHGLSAEARRWCTATARIPMARGVESLNASVAGAIMMYEVARQRRHARPA